ncbi:MAG: type I glyceraldehyde-3-phosphate dehydrogenase [Neptuniibacter sp.]
MPIRIAINGYGRIGRNILRALYEGPHKEKIQIVAINDLGNIEINTHLTKYDSTHGPFPFSATHSENFIEVGSDKIRYLQVKQIRNLPWKELEIDLVLECTGLFTNKEKAQEHIESGARRVLISAPGTDADATVVFGVNHHTLKDDHIIISNASCTTNCLAPLVKVLNDTFGIKSGSMTTIHAFTNDQHLVDINSGDPYRSRAATLSMIPTKTGAAAAIGLVLPELDGKLKGMAVRVPTANVSLVDLTLHLNQKAFIDEINNAIFNAAQGHLKGIIQYNDLPLVSIDFNHNSASCVFDSTHTSVCGEQAKVLAWYDNEWGFSNRMLDLANYIATELN